MTARPASEVEALLRLVREARQDLRTRRENEGLGEARPAGDHRRDAVETDLGVVEVATEELRVAEGALRAEHEALQSARRSQARWLQALWDTFPMPVLRTDLAGTLTWVNGGAAALLGTHAEALPRTPLSRYLPVADRRSVRDVLSDLRRGMSTSQATVHLGPSGRPGRMVALLGMPDAPSGAEGALHVLWIAFPVGPEPAADSEWLAATASLLETTTISTDTNHLLHQVAVQATRLVPGADGATVVLGSPDHATHLAASSHFVQTGDGAQAIAGEGPTSQAYLTGLSCHSPDLRAETRWPRLAQLSDHRGARDVLAEPVVDADGGVVGVLTLYAGAARSFGPADIEIAGRTATVLATLLRATREHARVLALVEQLGQALTNRGVVERAKGVLMMVCDVDADEALAILTGMSNRENLRLVEVAHRVLEARGLPGELSAPPSG